ncbi:MAG: hypothetical protein FWD84_02565 [Oscillospiraceae bacterium]|nr:hypothetical protein [Oscillospiraceae bacterium]
MGEVTTGGKRMSKGAIRKRYVLLVFMCITVFVGCAPQGELVSTIHFADEITGRTFERETWEVNSFPGGISHQTRFYETGDKVPRRRPITHLLYERLPGTAYGGIELHHPRHGGRYNIPLYEAVPFSLSLDEMRVYFTRVSTGIDITFSISSNELVFYFSNLMRNAWGARNWVHTNAFALEISEEQLQEVLRSLERAEQVLRTDREALILDDYYWDIRLVFDHHTTFFYIDGEATYRLLRYLMNHPIDQADPSEVNLLREIYNAYNLRIQEARIARRVRWHEKNNAWDRAAGIEVREAAQAELQAILEYYDAKIQMYFDDALQKLTEAYEDSNSNVSWEYFGFKLLLTAIFERSDGR